MNAMPTPKYKQAYLDAEKEDIKIIISPVGMPGRAIRNELIKKVEEGRIPPKRCYNCIKKCNPKRNTVLHIKSAHRGG